MAPGEHFQQVAAAFDRGEVFPLQSGKVAVIQAPMVLARLLAVGRLHQGQSVFGQVRGDAGVDELDLAGLALERRIQAAAQYIEFAFIDRAGGVFAAGELGEEAVAVVQLIDQSTALGGDLAHFPLAAAVQQGQLARVPAPLMRQAFQQLPLPTGGALAGAELAVDLQVQAAAHQFQALQLVAGLEVFLDAAVDHDVRVQLIQVYLMAEHRLFEAQAQAAHVRVFACVDLGQQQLEHRLVGRLDALEQLPQPGPDKLPWRNMSQMAEVEGFIGADKTLGHQGVSKFGVAAFFVDRHQPPDGRAPGQPDRGAIELIQQQVVLGGAAVVGTQLRIAITQHKARRVDQEEMRFGAHAQGPGFQQLALFAQLGQLGLVQVGGVAHPHVHIALIGLGQRAQAAHQEQTVDRRRRVAVARFIGKRAGQALGIGQGLGVRFEIRQPGRRAAGDVAWQQRVIDVEKQRQQGQHALLTWRQPLDGPGHAALIEGHETRAQLGQHLAVDAFVQIGADFMGAGHVELVGSQGPTRAAMQEFTDSSVGVLEGNGFLASEFCMPRSSARGIRRRRTPWAVSGIRRLLWCWQW